MTIQDRQFERHAAGLLKWIEGDVRALIYFTPSTAMKLQLLLRKKGVSVASLAKRHGCSQQAAAELAAKAEKLFKTRISG